MTNLLAALTLVYVFSSNLTTVSRFIMPERVAPGVTRYNAWYVISGTLQGGQQVNLIPAALHNDFSSRG